MSAILVNGNPEVTRKIMVFAEKLGANIIDLNDQQFEDLALGLAMDMNKTDELVAEELIMKKLSGS